VSTGDSLVCPLESWFPKSVDAVLGWTSLSETVKRKLFWDNAVACYARYGARIGAQAT